MTESVRRQTPDRPHYVVSTRQVRVPGVRVIRLDPGGAWSLYRQARTRLRRIRVALAPTLFTASKNSLRAAAILYVPIRVLGFNASLQRHHLRLTRPRRTWQFLSGRPLDQAAQRPAWIRTLRGDGPDFPDGSTVYEGRPLSAARPRIGIATPYFPYPLASGGAVRIFNLLREAAREFDVFLFSFDDPYNPSEVAPVLEHCARVALVRPHPGRPSGRSLWTPREVAEVESGQMKAAISRIRAEYRLDLTQVEYTQMARYQGDILTEHDLTFHLYRQVRDRSPGLRNWSNYLRWRGFEASAVKRFSRVIFVSEEEATLLDCGGRSRVIPNGVDLERFSAEPERSGCRILFIGSFGHFPNVWAYRQFFERIYPAIRARFPEVKVTIVGGRNHGLYWRIFTNSMAPPTASGIEILDFVPDVRPLYHRANVVIAPNTVSGGTNIKVLEAMALERAIMTTACGCAGLGLRHGESAWIADDPEAFAEGVAALLGNPELRRKLARNARIIAERDFDWRAIGGRLRAVYHELMEERRCGTSIRTR